MKIIKIITEFEVPDEFDDEEALSMFIQGMMDNAPEPSDIDKSLKDVSIGLTYGENTVHL